jgi:hypothetical protein
MSRAPGSSTPFLGGQMPFFGHQQDNLPLTPTDRPVSNTAVSNMWPDYYTRNTRISSNIDACNMHATEQWTETYVGLLFFHRSNHSLPCPY